MYELPKPNLSPITVKLFLGYKAIFEGSLWKI